MDNAWDWSSGGTPDTYDELVDGLREAAGIHLHPS